MSNSMARVQTSEMVMDKTTMVEIAGLSPSPNWTLREFDQGMVDYRKLPDAKDSLGF